MPLPDHVNILDLSGRYVLDTKLCLKTSIIEVYSITDTTSPDFVEAACSDDNTMEINHFKDTSGVDHLELRQSLRDGTPGLTGKFMCGWNKIQHEDPSFGPVVVQARHLSLGQLDSKVKGSWDIVADSEDAIQNGVIQLQLASDSERTSGVWKLQLILAIVDTKQGKRLAWLSRTSGSKDGIVAEGIHYMDYLGPLRAVKVTNERV